MTFLPTKDVGPIQHANFWRIEIFKKQLVDNFVCLRMDNWLNLQNWEVVSLQKIYSK